MVKSVNILEIVHKQVIYRILPSYSIIVTVRVQRRLLTPIHCQGLTTLNPDSPVRQGVSLKRFKLLAVIAKVLVRVPRIIFVSYLNFVPFYEFIVLGVEGVVRELVVTSL